MKIAFFKEVVRSIKLSPGRFLAILCIVGIGCGFFAGLKMCGIDMREGADAYFNATNLFDLELVCSDGIGDAVEDEVKTIDGVEDVQASKSVDVVGSFNTERYALRVTSLDVPVDTSSITAGTINKLQLESGRWPAASDECVVLASRTNKIESSDTVSIQDAGNANLLATDMFHVVGEVSAPEYSYSTNLGTSSVGSGLLQQVLYVPTDAFVESVPNTALYISVADAADSLSKEDAYANAIEYVETQIDGRLEEFATTRKDELKERMLAQLRGNVSKAQLATASTLEDPTYYLLDRKQNFGAQSYLDDSKRIDNIATVFPLIFFLVAALVALTTMTRMVEDDRELIGTHKALGYNASLIAGKYLIYATFASCVGAVLGIAILSQLLPAIIINSYAITYSIPSMPLPLPIHAGYATSSLVLGVGITLAATLLAAVATTRSVPAQLMREKAPKPGKRILLEYITPLWSRFSFITKVTLRNIFRYKRRLGMTIIGIAGCSALLLCGVGIRDAINDIIDLQFGEIFEYNTIVGLDAKATAGQIEHVETYIESLSEVSETTALRSINQVVDKGDDTQANLTVIVPNDASELTKSVTLRNRIDGNPIAFDSNSCILTEKLARTLSLSADDNLTLYDVDATGNKTNTLHTVTISAVTENYANSYLYMGKDAYNDVFDTAYKTNTLWISASEDESFQDTFANDLQNMDGVSTVIFNSETIALYRSLLKTMDMVMGVLIGSAAVLACVVLYNLSNINISERKKEIATLKVLGFTSKEVALYVFKEIALLVILGALLGLVLGVFLEGYVVSTAELDALMFARIIHPTAYVFAFVATLGFALCVMVAMVPKLVKIDMVESLKAGE